MVCIFSISLHHLKVTQRYFSVYFIHSLFLQQQTPDAMSKVKRFFSKKYTKKDVEDAQKKYSEVVSVGQIASSSRDITCGNGVDIV